MCLGSREEGKGTQAGETGHRGGPPGMSQGSDAFFSKKEKPRNILNLITLYPMWFPKTLQLLCEEWTEGAIGIKKGRRVRKEEGQGGPGWCQIQRH